jgi:hypothetical protein
MNSVLHNLLRDNHDITVCCMDNNQQGHPMKFQRNGVSNRFIKVTGRIIKEATLFSINSIKHKAVLSFTEQAIQWKKIKTEKVSDNFTLCRGMALLV